MAHLYTEFKNEAVKEAEISSTDQTIYSYIEKYGNIIYDVNLLEEADWQIFYNLSELRTGIVSWYEFKPDSSVLEIGAGFGALTGRLCQKCVHVTATERSLYRAQAIAKRYEAVKNLDIYVGDIEDMEFAEKFDYIVLVGILEKSAKGKANIQAYVQYLQLLKKYLKPDGKLLVAVENRFGLKYFCGAPEPHTNRAFDGLNHYRKGTEGYSFSRQELVEVIKEAGFGGYKFYYPLPDYKLPQLIYTDDYLPERNLKERLIPYYTRNDTLVAGELELYDDIIANGVFPFFANSFLVECNVDVETPMGQVVYAAVSTDRGEERSYATTIHKNGLVYKTPLYTKGQQNAALLYENILDLQQHGIPVVQHHKLSDDSLELPYIAWPTLSNSIKHIIKVDEEKFLRLLDKLWNYILQSSEQVTDPQKGNVLVGKLKSEAETEEQKQFLEELDFGPILKKAYMELIPLNCFYNEKTGEFLYFDQEFVRENYPAKYVLFRAIHYIYCFTPNAEQYYPLQKLKRKYDMEATWDIYLQEEQRFLDEVRNREQYRQFYRWTQVDWNRIQENANRLVSEDEKVANYQISHKMKQVWKIELEMLDAVDKICKKHGLTYFLVHGSLLGAVRHKGFIPWDDDLDIAMPRSDYDLFIKMARTELSKPLSVHTYDTENDIFWGGHARIRNSQTTGIEVKEIGHKGNLGIWIDVMPLDVCTEDEEKLARKQKRIRKCHRLLYAKIYGKEYECWMDMNKIQWFGYRLLSKFYPHGRLCRMLDTAMRMYTEEETKDVAFFTGYDKHRRLNAADFKDTAMMEFAGRKVPVPIGYENYLFISMGKDYLKYPPEEERKPKHRGIYDPEKPYAEYVSLLWDTFDNIAGKKIILFGAGLMYEDYMKKYGDKYRPDFLVDNDENKWGRYRLGVEIRNPKAILEIPKEKRRLIICSYYYREISQQLEAMGVQDYKVYVQNVEWILETEKTQSS